MYSERWIFINGVANTKAMCEKYCRSMESMFKRPAGSIAFVHNPTDGVFVDLLECAVGKIMLEYWEVAPRAKLRALLMRELKAESPASRVVLVAHSQGTIIAANALNEIINEADKSNDLVLKERLKRLDLYMFATCAHKVDDEPLGHVEHIFNGNDLVALLGVCHPDPESWLDTNVRKRPILSPSITLSPSGCV